MLSVGDLLKKTRIQKGLTFREIEKQLKVREKFLTAIEQNNWSVFTSKIYIAGIIRNYARILELDENKMLAFFRRDFENIEDVNFKKRIKNNYFKSESKRIIRLLIIAIIFFFIVYFAYQLKLYLSPPSVILLQPKNTVFKIEDKIHIVGQTDKDAVITIFGERVYQDKNGIFVYDYPIKSGKNELDIEVIGANGKKTEVKKIFIKSF